jgi:hypothetical protein
MTQLSAEQKKTVLTAIQYRCAQFPRSTLQLKLLAADNAYHLANVRLKNITPDLQDDSYSRFQELDNALVREVGETYSAFYINTYLDNTQIFSMTSGPAQLPNAQKFNVVMLDQQRQTGWRPNLSKWFTSISKYNLGMIEVCWDTRVPYAIKLEREAASSKTTRDKTVWKGNAVKHIDLYNAIFDHKVDPTELHIRGEFSGYVELMTQVELFNLVSKLKLDGSGTVYDTDATNPNFNIYKVATNSQQSTYNMHYIEPDVTPLGAKDSRIAKNETNWAQEFGYTQDTIRKDYTVTKMYLRLVPSAYSFPKVGDQESIELWEFYILEGTHLLYSKRMETAHGFLPTVLGQTDSDALGINAAGPSQVAIPYQKTAKQLLDRVMAGADRAIRDRAIFDHRFIDADKLNSSIPDAKIPTKASLTGNKTLDSVYKSIPYTVDTADLAGTIERMYMTGMRAAGINNAQAGQFTKGNRTLSEYEDIQSNAVSKQFIRALFLESTAMEAIKTMIKLNILQFQEAVTLYDPQSKQKIDIQPSQLYEADVEFKLADGLMPTKDMLSPNVQQQLLATIQAMPMVFQEYNIPKIVLDTIQQSNGADLEKYKLTPEERAVQDQQLAAMQQQQAPAA